MQSGRYGVMGLCLLKSGLDLTQNLRLSQHHGIETASDAHHMASGICLDKVIEVWFEQSVLDTLVRCKPRLKDAEGIGLTHRNHFCAITG